MHILTLHLRKMFDEVDRICQEREKLKLQLSKSVYVLLIENPTMYETLACIGIYPERTRAVACAYNLYNELDWEAADGDLDDDDTVKVPTLEDPDLYVTFMISTQEIVR